MTVQGQMSSMVYKGRSARSRSSAKPAGFLLIELMIAMFVLTVGFLALLGTFPSSVASINQAKDTMYMTHIARQQMEYVLSKSFATTTLSTNGTVSKYSTVDDRVLTTNYLYTVTVNPDTALGLEAASKKTVVVMVYEQNRPYQYVMMETHMARQQ